MKSNQIVFGLDIGTTKIVCLAGKLNEYGKLEVVGVGKSKSLGVKRGIVNNIMQTVESINHAVSIINENFDLKVHSVCTGIAGQHIRSLQHSDYITREKPESFIDKTDIQKLHKNVKKFLSKQYSLAEKQNNKHSSYNTFVYIINRFILC